MPVRRSRQLRARALRHVMEYRLTYQVQAPNQLMAWMGAGALLRTGVVVKEIEETKRLNGDWWEVTLAVEEDIPEPHWLHEDPEFAEFQR